MQVIDYKEINEFIRVEVEYDRSLFGFFKHKVTKVVYARLYATGMVSSFWSYENGKGCSRKMDTQINLAINDYKK